MTSIVFAVVCLGTIFATPAAAGTFRLGYAGPELKSESAATRDVWSQRARESGAAISRINVSWAQIAPTTPPAGFVASDPSSPGYRWESLDAAVKTAVAHGLEVMFTVQRAPSWAEGAGRPGGIEKGAWKPDATAYGEFARALGERFSGSFPDPLEPGTSLPRVRYFDAWNESNLVNFLAPQVESGRLVGPTIYRKLLNRFYAGIKGVQPDATVLGSSFAPFGATNGTITPPVLFLRSLLCLRGNQLKPVTCPEKAHLDALSAHPIQVGPPTESALSPFDVTTPDLGRLTPILRAAEKARTVRSSGRIGLWVTEFWVDSSPPDPQGIPIAQQARWYEQDMYEFWQAGAEVAIELLVGDQAEGGLDPSETMQTGVYFINGEPKPSHTAMRFPFVAQRASGGVQVWGIAPTKGTVRVQALRGGTWTTVARVAAGGRSRPFTAKFELSGSATLRAQIGSEASLSWALG